MSPSVDFVVSPAALRIWRTSKESGMALPTFSSDDFIDFCVAEALMLRAKVEEIEAEKDAERREWQNKPLGSGGAMKGGGF